MIDPEIPLASWLLLTSRILFLVVYALPLLFVPMRWARVFRWEVPERTHMTINLGRCLGGVELTVILAVFRAVPNPRAHRMLFDLIALMTGILALVHVWGAIPLKAFYNFVIEKADLNMRNPCDAPILAMAFRAPKQVSRRILDRETVE